MLSRDGLQDVLLQRGRVSRLLLQVADSSLKEADDLVRLVAGDELGEVRDWIGELRSHPATASAVDHFAVSLDPLELRLVLLGGNHVGNLEVDLLGLLVCRLLHLFQFLRPWHCLTHLIGHLFGVHGLHPLLFGWLWNVWNIKLQVRHAVWPPLVLVRGSLVQMLGVRPFKGVHEDQI